MKNTLRLLAIMLIVSGCADKPDSDGMQEQCGNIYCDPGTSCCDGHCIDKTSDNYNCGACGNYCGKFGECSNSQCLCKTGGSETGMKCGSGQICCSAGCVNVSKSADNCGDCGVVCPVSPNTSLHYSSIAPNPSDRCDQGVCKLICDEGYVDADKKVENGCECVKGTACDTTPVQPSTTCTEGSFACEGVNLMKCGSNSWNFVEACLNGKTCDAAQHACVCTNAAGCGEKPVETNTPGDFEWLDTSVSASNPKSTNVGNVNVNVAATVIEGGNAISGKRVIIGPEIQSGGIDVTGISGLVSVSFDYRLLTATAVSTIHIVFSEQLGGAKTFSAVLANGKATFDINDSTSTFFKIYATDAAVIIDNLTWQ